MLLALCRKLAKLDDLFCCCCWRVCLMSLEIIISMLGNRQSIYTLHTSPVTFCMAQKIPIPNQKMNRMAFVNYTQLCFGKARKKIVFILAAILWISVRQLLQRNRSDYKWYCLSCICTSWSCHLPSTNNTWQPHMLTNSKKN